MIPQQWRASTPDSPRSPGKGQREEWERESFRKGGAPAYIEANPANSQAVWSVAPPRILKTLPGFASARSRGGTHSFSLAWSRERERERYSTCRKEFLVPPSPPRRNCVCVWGGGGEKTPVTPGCALARRGSGLNAPRLLCPVETGERERERERERESSSRLPRFSTRAREGVDDSLSGGGLRPLAAGFALTTKNRASAPLTLAPSFLVGTPAATRKRQHAISSRNPACPAEPGDHRAFAARDCAVADRPPFRRRRPGTPRLGRDTQQRRVVARTPRRRSTNYAGDTTPQERRGTNGQEEKHKPQALMIQGVRQPPLPDRVKKTGGGQTPRT